MRPSTQTLPSASPPSKKWPWEPWLLIGAILCAYSNSFRGAFIFDDEPSILTNPTLRNLWSAWSPPNTDGVTVSGRPFLNFTLAVNYALGGTSVWSYHVFNLLIHVASALILFDLVRRTLQLPSFAAKFGPCAREIALVGTALWSLHPLQTEAVTYIIQRAESLVSLCYLATLWAFLRATDSKTPGRWLIVSVLGCALGMATKEVMVSAPLVVTLYDRLFIDKSKRTPGTSIPRRLYYLGLAASWAILFVLVRATSGRGGSAGFDSTIAPTAYAATQIVAVTHYLRLILWPRPLIFDYGRLMITDRWQIAGCALFLVPLIVGAIWSTIRGNRVGFCAVVFFALLAPSSSVVPVVTQTMAEHRIYLPLAAFTLFATLGVYRVVGRKGLLVLSSAAVGLGVTTFARNRDYASALTIWSDTVAKLPENPRAQNNLALALTKAGRPGEANEHFKKAVAQDKSYISARYNWGVALLESGELTGAIEQLGLAVKLAPAHVDAQVNLGNALVRADRPGEAISHYEAALKILPAADLHYDLGCALARTGKAKEAENEFNAALAADSSNANAHYQLALLKESSGDLEQAEHEYRAALLINSNHTTAHSGLGLLLAQSNQLLAASIELEIALRLDPSDPDINANLGNIRLLQGRTVEAIKLYETALHLRPGDARTLQNLEVAREQFGINH